MPEALPSPDALPSQGGPVEILPPMLTGHLCLACKLATATQVEGVSGFTLCNSCYFGAGLDGLGFMDPLPPRTAQDRLIAVLMAENERLRRALYACERILSGGEA